MEPTPTINERIAVLETKMDAAHESLDTIRTDGEHRDVKQDKILDTLNSLVKDMASAKTFMGGAMWMAAAMVAFIYKLGPWLLSLIRSKTGNG